MFHAEKQKDKHETNFCFSQFGERAGKKHCFPQARRLRCFHAFAINVRATCNTNHEEKTNINFCILIFCLSEAKIFFSKS